MSGNRGPAAQTMEQHGGRSRESGVMRWFSEVVAVVSFVYLMLMPPACMHPFTAIGGVVVFLASATWSALPVAARWLESLDA